MIKCQLLSKLRQSAEWPFFWLRLLLKSIHQCVFIYPLCPQPPSPPLNNSASTVLVPTGDQDPTIHLTQSFWMAVAPPILVANNI